jgi:hypothetical protein
MTDQPDLGEQALDKVAELAIKSQLDQAEHVEVDIRTNPINLMQGKVESVNIAGKGMVIKQELRVETIQVEASSVNVNPLKALTGQVELTQPAGAEAKILLTEADLNRALQSDYLRRKMQSLEISVQQSTCRVDLGQAVLKLLDDGKIALDATIVLPEQAEEKQIMAVVIPSVQDNGHRIDLEIVSAEGKGLSLEFITALFQEIVTFLDFRNFDLDGISMQLQRIIVQPQELLIHATTVIEKIPEIAE